MLSKRVALALGIILIVIFASITFVTIEKASSSSSIGGLSSGGYVKIQNGTGLEPLYTVNNTSTQIDFNFTIYTNSPVVYMYDISPLSTNHNSSLNAYNLTSFNSSQYPYNYILQNNTRNGTVIHMSLQLNENAIKMMNYTTNPEDPQVYIVKIVIINGKDGDAGFGFGVIRPYPSP